MTQTREERLEHNRAYCRQYYQDRREERLAYYHAHSEERSVKAHDRYMLHRDELLEYRKAHREEFAEKSKNRYHNLHLEVIKHYGDKCMCCGETIKEFLCIDHINGGGCKHRKEIGGGSYFYVWLKKNNYPDGFQVLCHNCNQAKSAYGECPHKDGRNAR
jgi:hypothetical protein